MLTLAVDSTGKAASAALVQDGRLLAERYTCVGLQHSRTLMPMVEAVLTACELSLSSVDRFAVCVGPGSFTGVRIGVAAVKGMALPGNVPCAPLSSLAVLAMGTAAFEGLLCPVLDARRGQFYNALFTGGADAPRRLVEDRAIAAEALAEELLQDDRPLTLCGDGAELLLPLLQNRRQVRLAPEPLRYPRAAFAALLGETAPVTTPEALRPLYLRPPQAERLRAERLNQQ